MATNGSPLRKFPAWLPGGPPLPPAPAPILGGELLVGYSQPQTPLAVVPLPAEINVDNAREVGRDLLAAVVPGVTAVVADLTATTFCDLPGAHMLALVRSQQQCKRPG
jgi:hypothetical protein